MYIIRQKNTHALAIGLLFGVLTLVNSWQDSYGQKYRQTDELGLPLIKTFSPKETKSDPQSLSICQDKRGMIYGCFPTQVKEFDGERWEAVLIIGMVEKRVLAYDPRTDTLYVGCNGTFGCSLPVVSGKRQFVNLTQLIPKHFPKFNEVWSVGITAQGIYIYSDEALLRWHQGKFTHLKQPKVRLFMGFQVGQHYFVNDKAGNIFQVVGDELKLVCYSKMLEKDGIFAMATLKQTTQSNRIPSEILCATRYNGLMVLTNDSLKAFPTAINEQLKQTRPYTATRLLNGNIAIGTLGNGLFIIAPNGQLVHHLTRNNGLADDFVLSLLEDREGLLWVGTSNGLCKVAASHPISIFDARQGFLGNAYSIARLGEKLHFSGLDGITQVVVEPNMAKLVPRAEFKSECNQLVNIENQLWAATNTGVFILEEGKPVFQLVRSKTKCILHSKTKPNTVYVSGREGLLVFQKNNLGVWQFKERIKIEGTNIYALEEDNEGHLWIGNNNDDDNNLIKIIFNHSFKDFRIIQYDSTHGVHFKLVNEVIFLHQGLIHICSPHGLIRYDPKQDAFKPVKIFGLGPEWGLSYAASASKEDLWGQVYQQTDNQTFQTIFLQKQSNDSYVVSVKPFAAISGQHYVYNFYTDSNQVTWANSSELLIRFDGKQRIRLVPFQTVIRAVQTLSLEASKTNVNIEADDSELSLSGDWSLSYDAKRILRFQFGALSYHDPEQNQFRYRLLGLNEEWSDWTTSGQLDYNSLWEGNYVLEVESRNIYQTPGSRTRLSFRISPPWHRSIWAYLAYAGVIIFGAWGYAHYRGRQLVKANEVLTEKVNERTKEIAHQNRALATSNIEINSQKAQLEQAYEELNANMEQIREQNDLIYKKNNKIEDSIRYAYQIQQAILPDQALMVNAFAHQFVFYRPKDIVSGDYYWMTVREEMVFFALADCTGHGVPGAFMSVLGSNALDHAVLDLHLSDPDTVLFQIDRQIVSYLHQDATSTSKDGMDVAFCAWNPALHTLSYAGAGRPIYLVQRGTLNIIKPDKYPIGGGQYSVKDFQQHTFQLSAGDRLYLFSDGITDQFGGPQRTKFTPKRLQQFILAHQHLSMEEQGQGFQRYFEEWIGDHIQIDDLTLWGIEF
jgi:serine phosphatase RsbU (regulator of sigma subunit)